VVVPELPVHVNLIKAVDAKLKEVKHPEMAAYWVRNGDKVISFLKEAKVPAADISGDVWH
jgi:hypothetical protein